MCTVWRVARAGARCAERCRVGAVCRRGESTVGVQDTGHRPRALGRSFRLASWHIEFETKQHQHGMYMLRQPSSQTTQTRQLLRSRVSVHASLYIVFVRAHDMGHGVAHRHRPDIHVASSHSLISLLADHGVCTCLMYLIAPLVSSTPLASMTSFLVTSSPYWLKETST